jgi:hypothetical protein
MDALGLENDATRNLSLLHALVYRAEVLQRLDDNLRDDLAAKSKVEGLDGVLPVSDVRSDDLWWFTRRGSEPVRRRERSAELDLREEP